MVVFDSADFISVFWLALVFSCASASFAFRHEFFQCLHWHILHCRNMSLLRSSLCWFSHWAKCCFAQASNHLESCFSSAFSYFSPTPCKLSWIFLWTLTWTVVSHWVFQTDCHQILAQPQAGGGLVLFLASRFYKIPLLQGADWKGVFFFQGDF